MESAYEVKDVSSSFSKEEQDGLKRFLPANAYICAPRRHSPTWPCKIKRRAVISAAPASLHPWRENPIPCMQPRAE